MGFLDWLRGPDQAALDAAMSVAEGGPAFMVDATAIDPAVFGLTAYASPTSPAPRVDRAAAIQVPAVKHARDLIAGTIGQLPVDLLGPDRSRAQSPLLAQPEPGVPRSVTMTKLVEDMLFERDAWWRITRFDWTNYPADVKRLDPRRVTVNDDAPRCATVANCSGTVSYAGKHLHDAEVIRFPSPNDALLVAGARAIRTCLALDSAAFRNADGAPPMDYFTPKPGGTDPLDTEVTATLDGWTQARRERSTGYVPSGWDYHTAGWSPEQLQMADARNQAVLEIARLAGIDADELGVPVTSRTYANQFDRRKQFTDFTLGAYMTAIQDRLSMPDVSPRGYVARFNLSAFMRSDDLTRFQTYEVGLRVGAIAQPEVREAEDKPALDAPTAPAPAPTPEVTR